MNEIIQNVMTIVAKNREFFQKNRQPTNGQKTTKNDNL